MQHTKCYAHTTEAGFTLTELIVTVAIVGVVAGSGWVSLSGDSKRSVDAARATAEGVSRLRRVLPNSDATSPEVLAFNLESGLSFPPDARGTIDVKLSRTGVSLQMQNVTIITKLLKKEGGVLQLVPVSEQSYPVGQIALRKALAGFDHTGQLQFSSNALWLEGLTEGANNVYETFRSYCYSNGTCDPITYYFSSMEFTQNGRAYKEEEKDRARIAVSATGSVVVAQEKIVDESNQMDEDGSGGSKGK